MRYMTAYIVEHKKPWICVDVHNTYTLAAARKSNQRCPDIKRKFIVPQGFIEGLEITGVLPANSCRVNIKYLEEFKQENVK